MGEEDSASTAIDSSSIGFKVFVLLGLFVSRENSIRFKDFTPKKNGWLYVFFSISFWMRNVFLGLSFLGESSFVNNGNLFLINICLFSNYLWYGVVLGFGQALR